MILAEKHVTEVGPHQFSTEASTLWGVGPWPTRIDTSLGNGLALLAKAVKKDNEGEVYYVDYQQVAGCVTVRVFND